MNELNEITTMMCVCVCECMSLSVDVCKCSKSLCYYISILIFVGVHTQVYMYTMKDGDDMRLYADECTKLKNVLSISTSYFRQVVCQFV